jgi:hypothetical protein
MQMVKDKRDDIERMVQASIEASPMDEDVRASDVVEDAIAAAVKHFFIQGRDLAYSIKQIGYALAEIDVHNRGEVAFAEIDFHSFFFLVFIRSFSTSHGCICL